MAIDACLHALVPASQIYILSKPAQSSLPSKTQILLSRVCYLKINKQINLKAHFSFLSYMVLFPLPIYQIF